MSIEKFLRSVGAKVSRTSFVANQNTAITEMMKRLSVAQSIQLDPFKYDISTVKRAVYQYKKETGDYERKFSIRYRQCQNNIIITRVK